MEKVVEKVEAKVLLGYFTVSVISDGSAIRKWHPNTSLGIPASAQFDHNCAIDPFFRIVEIFPAIDYATTG